LAELRELGVYSARPCVAIQYPLRVLGAVIAYQAQVIAWHRQFGEVLAHNCGACATRRKRQAEADMRNHNLHSPTLAETLCCAPERTSLALIHRFLIGGILVVFLITSIVLSTFPAQAKLTLAGVCAVQIGSQSYSLPSCPENKVAQ
jgi:hypothetical protein